MLNATLLSQEIYLIPLNNRTLCYSPLTRGFALYDGFVERRDIDPEWLKENTDIRNVPDFIREDGFSLDKSKVRLRLNITNMCNLGCSYCSVNASDGKVAFMTEKVAMGAIDSFSKLAQDSGAQVLEMVFSGGEPTLRMDFIKKMIDYAKAVVGSGIKLVPRLLTNGVFHHDRYATLLTDIHEVQVSWDGPSSLSPRYEGKPEVAQLVWDTIGFLIKSGKPLSVLTVVSEKNSSSIRQIVDELYDQGVRNIFLSIQETLGRSVGKQVEYDYPTLGKEYFNLWRDYREKGTDINLTGTDIHSVSPYPCSVPIPNYSVAPNGSISACTISFNEDSPESKSFNIGSVSSGQLVLDKVMIESVRQYHALNLPECSLCFAKWHCRGGCIYAKQGEWFHPLSAERCEMVRDIIANKILHVITNE